MRIGHATAATVLLQARGTVNPGREKIVRAIQRLQIMSVEIDERFQRLATLQSAKDITEQRPQVVGLDRIEEGPHLGVTVDAVDGAEVVVGISTALVEGQQERILEREHGKRRHQGVAEGDFDRGRTRIGHAVEAGASQSEEGISGEILAGRQAPDWQFLLPGE